MIVFDLACQELGHRFEGWFASSGAFADQHRAGLVVCPHCGSSQVEKAMMAPAVARKGNQGSAGRPSPASASASAPSAGSFPAAKRQISASVPSREAARVMRALATMQAEALKSSRWVGDSFAEEARAMHYGEREHETIHGQATAKQAEALHEEGIAVAALPYPVAPPGQAN